jgi:hypothetical protein
MTVSTNSSGIFSCAATSSAAPNAEMLRMAQTLFERPNLIEPSLTTWVERGCFSTIISSKQSVRSAQIDCRYCPDGDRCAPSNVAKELVHHSMANHLGALSAAHVALKKLPQPSYFGYLFGG